MAKTIGRAGLDVFQTFNQVGLDVERSTNGSQQPWTSSSPIDGNFYFGGAPPVPAASTGSPADEITWNFVKDTRDIDQLRRFIEQFPQSSRRKEASARLLMIEKAQERQQDIAMVVPPAKLATPTPPVQQTIIVPPAKSAAPVADAPKPAIGQFPEVRAAKPLSVELERALIATDRFKECETCPEMIVVPAGSFTMGSPANEKDRESDEGPQHRVEFSRPFAVGRFAVTFDEWDSCVGDGGCNGYKPADQGWGRGRQPVVNVSKSDALSYLVWLNRKSGKQYRLLSESEREYVARAGTTTTFWWGSSINASQANYMGRAVYDNGQRGEFRQRTVPVDFFAPNPWGLYQVQGNILEWVEDCYHDNYVDAPGNGSAWLGKNCNQQVVRGGSWSDTPKILRSANRDRYRPDGHNNGLGFRVARAISR